MSSIAAYGRWIAFGSWRRERLPGSSMTWGRLAASWVISTVLVAVVFALLAAGGLLGGVAVALLWPFAQTAVVIGLIYTARSPRRTT